MKYQCLIEKGAKPQEKYFKKREKKKVIQEQKDKHFAELKFMKYLNNVGSQKLN